MSGLSAFLALDGGAPVGLHAYLLVAALLFAFGLTACLARRNAIGILIGIELILNAAILNFMAFWRFGASGDDVSGPMFGIFMIILAACEAAVALAVLLNLYFNFGTVEVDDIAQLRR
ncbi:MAG TPA: NADH-quinone oxidoreductase subunit NuoK [Candidatus Sumerlaeota bacterium]|nr:MAG: NADH-quinone oxidoreductase subunit K [candidate division BRC1 bacterium ADurb.BinA292]HOE95477.1 NADH-quinone oxidoreductase subunit NuoK [Candidatus Sumerlaeota bacterium]HOR26383.1 NADH-quinone oxidoreductase subunit NuoK [Candidatus Sumerlaeota bacterium]HPK02601.1 NADH-quinone oxidoreductase subunit NuoK [Candidatus Sumerlaeota bacterium]